MNTTEITDERIRKYLMVWVDQKGVERGLNNFKGKKSGLPQEIVVMGSGGQEVCKLKQVKLDRHGNPRAIYCFDGWAYRKWFAM